MFLSHSWTHALPPFTLFRSGHSHRLCVAQVIVGTSVVAVPAAVGARGVVGSRWEYFPNAYCSQTD